MKIHIVSGKNTIVENHLVEVLHPMASRHPEDVFTGQNIMIEKKNICSLPIERRSTPLQ